MGDIDGTDAATQYSYSAVPFWDINLPLGNIRVNLTFFDSILEKTSSVLRKNLIDSLYINLQA
jgi:hypothetical protein